MTKLDRENLTKLISLSNALLRETLIWELDGDNADFAAVKRASEQVILAEKNFINQWDGHDD